MIDIKNFVRPNIMAFQAYSSARDEYKGREGIFLDANENPFGEYNRYPDPHQEEVRHLLAGMVRLDSENICLGNGSDEESTGRAADILIAALKKEYYRLKVAV